MQRLSAGQPCDITGIKGYQDLDEQGGIQWPYPRDLKIETPTQERRLFSDGQFFTPNGKANFVFSAPQPLPEPTSKNFPFVLLTGRGTSAQWHTQSRTNKSPVLRKLYPAELLLDLHPEDAQKLHITDRAQIEITSARAKITAQAHLTTTVQRGQVFLPMHEGNVNLLTHPSFDPYSRQPNYKHCAVNVSLA